MYLLPVILRPKEFNRSEQYNIYLDSGTIAIDTDYNCI